MSTVKSIYGELKGYLDQAPEVRGLDITNSELWEMFNNCVDELNKISESGIYNKFRLIPKFNSNGTLAVSRQSYRSKLGALISKLEGENSTFLNENNQAVGANIFNISQSQSVEIFLQLNLDFQSKIDEKLYKDSELDTNEKSFLEKVKSGLSKVKDYSSLILLIMTHANEIGLTVEQILKLFR